MATSLSTAGPHLTHDSLGPFESTAQTANRSVQPFLHNSQQKVPILYNGDPFPQSVPSRGEIEPPSFSWFLEADRALNPNCITIGSAICRAVTLPRRETRWNLQGCPKLPDRSQPLVGWSSPYCGNMWRRYCCLTIFFRLSICALVAKI